MLKEVVDNSVGTGRASAKEIPVSMYLT